MATRKQRQAYKPFLFLLFCTLILIISSCGGATGSSGGGGNNACNASSTASCAKQTDLRISVGHATQMRVHDSQVVKVTLNSISNTLISNDPLPIASIPAENATVTTTRILPVGTPTANLADAFGPGYQAYATATLTTMTGTFKIIPLANTSKPQSLNQVVVEWRWLITPIELGEQILDIDIEVIWKSQSAKLIQQGPVSIGDQQINIGVNLTASFTPTSTPTLAPTPTPTLVPTPTSIPMPTPTSSSSSSNNSSQSDNTAIIAAIIVAIATVAVAIATVVAALIGNQKRNNKKEKLTEKKPES